MESGTAEWNVSLSGSRSAFHPNCLYLEWNGTIFSNQSQPTGLAIINVQAFRSVLYFIPTTWYQEATGKMSFADLPMGKCGS